MARKSRKSAQLGIPEHINRSQYNTAIYARLSIEDNGTEGMSIENQIKLAKKYIKSKDNLDLCDIFVDNGFTGTNFDRPEFKNMIIAIKEKRINCIVVKDLSRFGRNYLEVGDYLERIFPYLDIRFIAISDNYDSNCPKDNSGLLISLKSIMHDIYAKDISKKVSSALAIKKKSGCFMLKIPPYGYMRSADNRHQLVIHTERAKVIEQIYQWRLEGMGATAIARKLNDMDIPTQMKLRYIDGHSDGKEYALWRGSSVSSILGNPYYIGCTVERKSKNLLYQNRQQITIPKSDWTLIPNTHQPIIDEETFYKVQELSCLSKQNYKLQRQKNKHRERTENIFGGKVVCGECGGTLQRDSGYYNEAGKLIRHSFQCHKRYVKNDGCSMISVKEDVLYETVLAICQKQVALLFDLQSLIQEHLHETNMIKQQTDFSKEIYTIEFQIKRLKEKRTTLYEDYKGDLLSESSYQFAKKITQQEINNLELQMKQLIHNQQQYKEQKVTNENWIDKYSEFSNLKVLTKEICNALINQIVIKQNTIKIKFAFQSEYEKSLLFLQGVIEGGEKDV